MINWNLPAATCTESAFGPFTGHSCMPTWAFLTMTVLISIYLGWVLSLLWHTWRDR